jgi:hypothetical protein
MGEYPTMTTKKNADQQDFSHDDNADTDKLAPGDTLPYSLEMAIRWADDLTCLVSATGMQHIAGDRARFFNVGNEIGGMSSKQESRQLGLALAVASLMPADDTALGTLMRAILESLHDHLTVDLPLAAIAEDTAADPLLAVAEKLDGLIAAGADAPADAPAAPRLYTQAEVDRIKEEARSATFDEVLAAAAARLGERSTRGPIKGQPTEELQRAAVFSDALLGALLDHNQGEQHPLEQYSPGAWTIIQDLMQTSDPLVYRYSVVKQCDVLLGLSPAVLGELTHDALYSLRWIMADSLPVDVFDGRKRAA